MSGGGGDDLTVLEWIVTVLIFAVLPLALMTLSALKGKWFLTTLGILAWPFALVGAIRLAKPGSFWATHWYGPEKTVRSFARFPKLAPRQQPVPAAEGIAVPEWPAAPAEQWDGATLESFKQQYGAYPRLERDTVGTEVRATLGTGVLVTIGIAGFLTLASFGIQSDIVVVALAVGLAIIPLPFWTALILWVDRFEPEPRRLLLEMFLWGAFVATLVAGIANELGQSLVSASLGKGAGELYGGSISAPVVEESMKAAAIYLVWRRARSQIDGVIDGIVYAFVVALGFAAVENVYYYTQGAIDDGVTGALGIFVLRGLFSPLAHPFFTAATGIGFGIAATTNRKWLQRLGPFIGLPVAILLHSAWNTSAISGETAFWVYLLFFVPLFAALVTFVLVVRRRDAKVVREELAPEVAAGVLSAAELEELSSLGARRKALKLARFTGGKAARKDRRQFHHAASEIAFARRRIPVSDPARKAALEQREAAALAALSHWRPSPAPG